MARGSESEVEVGGGGGGSHPGEAPLIGSALLGGV
jgi:hypothetical protein